MSRIKPSLKNQKLIKKITTPQGRGRLYVLAKKKYKRVYKWVNKPRTIRIKKWKIIIGAYIIFTLIPHHSPKPIALQPTGSPIFSSVSVLPLQPLKQPEIAPIASVEMADYPIAEPGTFGNDYSPGWCTWGIATMKRIPGNWGDAKFWAANAQAQGYTVSNTPIVGAIAQTDAGWAGHVAVIIAINGDTVTVKEMNGTLGLYNYDNRTTPVSDWVYIYI